MTPSGNIGVKVWVYRGDVLPEARKLEQPRPEGPAPAPSAERQPRKGWRRVGAARRPDVEAQAPVPGEETLAPSPEPAQATGEGSSDVDAVEGPVS